MSHYPRFRTAVLSALLGAIACTSDISVPAVPVASITISPSTGIWVENGQTLPLTATLKDSAGNVLSNRAVTWSVSDTTLATIDGEGRLTGRKAKARMTLGGTIVTAKSEGKTEEVYISTGNKPATIELLTASGGTYKSGAFIAGYPYLYVNFRILDSHGGPVWGIRPLMTNETGFSYTDGTISTKYGSDEQGIYASPWTMGTALGEKSLTASFPGATSATIRATVITGDPGKMAKLAGDAQTAASGASVSVRPSVRLTDFYDHPVAGVMLRFSVNGGGGTVTGADVVTDVNGIATVGSWTLGPAAGINMLSVVLVGSPSPSAQFTATGQ